MFYDLSTTLGAFFLTLLAGLATAIGGGIAVAQKKPSERLLAAGLGLSAGVMIYVSLVELLPQGSADLEGHGSGWAGLGYFFLGILIILVIDKFVPAEVNPHEPRRPNGEAVEASAMTKQLMRTGLLTAGVITLHNVPEGFATLVTSLDNIQAGIPIAVAVAIHNIPEGIAVAVPIYAATGSRTKAFVYALISGMAEPLGAGVLFLLLASFISPALIGASLCAVAGIMVFISFDELLPTAEKFGHHHAATYGVVAGMAIMGISLEALTF